MKVEALMTKHVHACAPDDSLASAAGIMWQHDCGCVPVVDENQRLLGMLTDRDICMSACMSDRRPHDIPVSEPMSKALFTCKPTDPLTEAEATMRRNRVRRLPVVDDRNRIVGLLSLNDLAREAERARKESRTAAVTDTQIRETLAAVSEPRRVTVTA